jgi:hypothetical protein
MGEVWGYVEGLGGVYVHMYMIGKYRLYGGKLQ